MKKILAALAFAGVFWVSSASAQLNVPVVTACAAQSYTAGILQPLTQDVTGDLCTNATGGGGGGNVTIASPLINGSVKVDTTGTGNLDQEIGSPVPPQAAAGVLIGSTQISDGACASSPCATNATVKAASTAPAATDKAVVVAQSPNGVDPCSQTSATKVSLAISSNATSLTQLIGASGSTKIYVCSIGVITASATAFNLNTGTGSNCASSTAALIGSTTAANGMSLAANGGFTLGNGASSIAITAASSEICILQSNSSYTSGVMTYVQQ